MNKKSGDPKKNKPRTHNPTCITDDSLLKGEQTMTKLLRRYGTKLGETPKAKKTTAVTKISRETALEMLNVVKTENQVMNLLELSGWEVNLCKKGIDKLKKQSNVMRVIRKTGFHKAVCDKGMSVLTDEKNILLVMKRSGWEHQICYKGIRKIKLKEKSEKELISLIKKSNFSLAIIRHILTLLKLQEKTWQELIDLLSELSYNSFCCREITPFFKFSERTSTENYEIIKAVAYNSIITTGALPYIIESDVLKVIMESAFNSDICRKAFEYITKPTSILEVLTLHALKNDLPLALQGVRRIYTLLNKPAELQTSK